MRGGERRNRNEKAKKCFLETRSIQVYNSVTVYLNYYNSVDHKTVNLHIDTKQIYDHKKNKTFFVKNMSSRESTFC